MWLGEVDDLSNGLKQITMVSSYWNLRCDTLQILSSVVKGLEVGVKYQSGFPRKQIQLILVLRNKQNENIRCVSLGTCAHGKLKRHLEQIKGLYYPQPFVLQVLWRLREVGTKNIFFQKNLGSSQRVKSQAINATFFHFCSLVSPLISNTLETQCPLTVFDSYGNSWWFTPHRAHCEAFLLVRKNGLLMVQFT